MQMKIGLEEVDFDHYNEIWKITLDNGTMWVGVTMPSREDPEELTKEYNVRGEVQDVEFFATNKL